MTSEQEKALLAALPLLKALARWHVPPASRMNDPDWGTVNETMHREARGYLASLEGVCPTCGEKWCRHHFGDHPEKPEPKRGVEEIIAYLLAEPLDPERGYKLREALRLYREERERVAKVAARLRADVGPGTFERNDMADELGGK